MNHVAATIQQMLRAMQASPLGHNLFRPMELEPILPKEQRRLLRPSTLEEETKRPERVNASKAHKEKPVTSSSKVHLEAVTESKFRMVFLMSSNTAALELWVQQLRQIFGIVVVSAGFWVQPGELGQLVVRHIPTEDWNVGDWTGLAELARCRAQRHPIAVTGLVTAFADPKLEAVRLADVVQTFRTALVLGEDAKWALPMPPTTEDDVAT